MRLLKNPEKPNGASDYTPSDATDHMPRKQRHANNVTPRVTPHNGPCPILSMEYEFKGFFALSQGVPTTQLYQRTSKKRYSRRVSPTATRLVGESPQQTDRGLKARCLWLDITSTPPSCCTSTASKEAILSYLSEAEGGGRLKKKTLTIYGGHLVRSWILGTCPLTRGVSTPHVSNRSMMS